MSKFKYTAVFLLQHTSGQAAGPCWRSTQFSMVTMSWKFVSNSRATSEAGQGLQHSSPTGEQSCFLHVIWHKPSLGHTQTTTIFAHKPPFGTYKPYFRTHTNHLLKHTLTFWHTQTTFWHTQYLDFWHTQTTFWHTQTILCHMQTTLLMHKPHSFGTHWPFFVAHITSCCTRITFFCTHIPIFCHTNHLCYNTQTLCHAQTCFSHFLVCRFFVLYVVHSFVVFVLLCFTRSIFYIKEISIFYLKEMCIF